MKNVVSKKDLNNSEVFKCNFEMQSYNNKRTDWVVGLVEVRAVRVVSCSGLVDSTNPVLVLVVLRQVGDFLPGVSDGVLHHLCQEQVKLGS